MERSPALSSQVGGSIGAAVRRGLHSRSGTASERPVLRQRVEPANLIQVDAPHGWGEERGEHPAQRASESWLDLLIGGDMQARLLSTIQWGQREGRMRRAVNV
jgi:hypothetical protein